MVQTPKVEKIRIRPDAFMNRLKLHFKVLLFAVLFGMLAYGFVHLGMVLHRQFL